MQPLDEKQKQFINKLEEIKNNNWTNLIISGKQGVGKTYIIKEIFKTYEVQKEYKEVEIEDGIAKEKKSYKTVEINPFFITDNEFKVQLASGNLVLKGPQEYANDDSKYPLEMLRKSDLIIYDDYGSSSITEAYLNAMINWIDKRLEKGLKTIWTSNLDRESIENRDTRIGSRIQQNSIVLVLSGNDKRKVNQEVFKF